MERPPKRGGGGSNPLGDGLKKQELLAERLNNFLLFAFSVIISQLVRKMEVQANEIEIRSASKKIVERKIV